MYLVCILYWCFHIMPEDDETSKRCKIQSLKVLELCSAREQGGLPNLLIYDNEAARSVNPSINNNNKNKI